MIKNLSKKPIMVLGTSSGAGKSLMATAICRYLFRLGDQPIPFKGQNMSNNAWVDINGSEMAYSQAVQAWAACVEPICAMNPILLKPQGDCRSEVIHLGSSVGISEAHNYYQDWFDPGWKVIQKGLNELLETFKNGRLILEGAGSPVEMNLQYRDLTNLRLAKYLDANCILVSDIERGGIFAQLIGTMQLLKPNERKLIKGIIINRFRGDLSLFHSGKDWIERNTNIPVLGVMPWLNDIFPPEDSLDLLERKNKKDNAEIEVAVIQLSSMSNFSDLDPLEAEESIYLRWIRPGESFGNPDAVIIPGSKQTLKDLKQLENSGLGQKIKEYVRDGGSIFGICGGLQILGESLYDPYFKEQTTIDALAECKGLCLLPIKTIFQPQKSLKRRKVESLWPQHSEITGFEMHYGFTLSIDQTQEEIEPIFKDSSLGWFIKRKNKGTIAGTYLHGIFDNGHWRRLWINELRAKKKLSPLETTKVNHVEKKEALINKLTDSFEEHIKLNLIM